MMLQFRASGVGKLMAYPDRDSLPVGAITAIYEKASQIILDWEPKLDLRVIEKGHVCEDEAIGLLNQVKGKNYVKNTTRLTTDLLTGEWDIYCKEEDLIIDIKNAYSKKTFPIFIKEGDKKDYEWQLTAYMALKNASRARIAYVLVDTPEELINPYDDINWHIVSHINPENRLTEFNMERCFERERQLLSRVKLAQEKLKEILEEKGFDYKSYQIDF